MRLLQVFFIFAVVTNLLVSTSMLQGCVAVVNALTGVNIYGEHPSTFSGRMIMSTVSRLTMRYCFTPRNQDQETAVSIRPHELGRVLWLVC